MQTNELREKYLAFFETKGHTRVASDVLVPTWDPSVLFTPAGMNQFKDHFLGKVKLDYTRATTCQKCMRTGDIDNVGRTPRHHTFFEMLGNFSFGDYFKRDAIHWAWEFLTDKKWLGLPPDTLTVTVYKDDQEAADIWHDEIGLATSRISYEEEDENFWPASAPSQGPDGVCGPCSEIYYTAPGREELEIWNLVFTQFNRVGDPPDNLRPLPSKNIDTGMGLERTAAALQDVETNFHIDILMPIVQAAAEVCGVDYKYDSENGRRLRRITDHVRACTFAVHENVYPGAKKEKYVVKRLLRRAVLDGYLMGLREPFLNQLTSVVAENMATAYPELTQTVERVSGVIKTEESNFFRTIEAGLNRIERVFSDMQKSTRTTVDGDDAFDMYQTYGFPPELFESIAAERNFAFDWDGFRKALQRHTEVDPVPGDPGDGIGMGTKGPIASLKRGHHKTEFVGYETTETESKIFGIVAGQPGSDHLCDKMEEVGHADPIRVVLDKTPFYGESGGQVGDAGRLVGEGFEFEVTDTQKDGELFIHYGRLLEGVMSEGDVVTATVETDRRDAIRRAHSATHLLHHALHKHLGEHAQQQGSKVDADWLRFDFSNQEPVDPAKLAAITEDVAADVAASAPVKWETLPLADARQQGAMMLFGEKYPDPVRMVSMGPLSAGTNSRELCGGTHLTNTSQVGAFEIISEEGVSSGTRRIVALTGKRAEEQASRTLAELNKTAELLKVEVANVSEAVKCLLIEQRSLKKLLSSGGQPSEGEGVAPSGSTAKLSYGESKLVLAEAARQLSVAPLAVAERVESLVSEVASLKSQLAERDAAGPLSADKLLESATEMGGTTVVVAETPGAPQNLMRQLIDTLRSKCESVAVLLAAREGDSKVTLIAGISKDLQDRGVSAGKWIGPVAKAVGGGGGGRPDMAQAGGKKPEQLPAALEVAKQTIGDLLAAD